MHEGVIIEKQKKGPEIENPREKDNKLCDDREE